MKNITIILCCIFSLASLSNDSVVNCNIIEANGYFEVYEDSKITYREQITTGTLRVDGPGKAKYGNVYDVVFSSPQLMSFNQSYGKFGVEILSVSEAAIDNTISFWQRISPVVYAQCASIENNIIQIEKIDRDNLLCFIGDSGRGKDYKFFTMNKSSGEFSIDIESQYSTIRGNPYRESRRLKLEGICESN